ncbi:hypothetical protein SeMB42_g07629, partial [Synchytrium endobioticum]
RVDVDDRKLICRTCDPVEQPRNMGPTSPLQPQEVVRQTTNDEESEELAETVIESKLLGIRLISSNLFCPKYYEEKSKPLGSLRPTTISII